MSHGAHSRELFERMALRARRSNQIPLFMVVGELKSYNPADSTVDVYLPHVDQSNTQTHRMPLMTPWLGPGYGEQGGPDASVTLQVVVANMSPDGDDYIALGFLYTANQTPPGTPPKEWWRVDGKGSSYKLTQDGKTQGDGAGGAKMAGAGYASITAPLTELGAENLNASEDAVIRKTDLDAALAAAFSILQSQLTTWASAHLQGGSGAGGPTLTANTSTGSTTVKAAS